MAFQPGNQAAAKARRFYEALMRAIAQDDGKRLRQSAETVLTKAANGEPWAIQFLADRLDGKPTQMIVGDPDRPLTIAADPIEQMRVVALALRMGMQRLEAQEAQQALTIEVKADDGGADDVASGR